MVTGTLRDQIIFPDKISRVDDFELESLLEKVNLKYLLKSYDNPMNNELKWYKVLSLGEIQRLAIARLLYHKPKFAVLDEVTSALDTENESRIYHILLENKITFIRFFSFFLFVLFFNFFLI